MISLRIFAKSRGVVICLILAGCSGRLPASVSGKITLDGRPLPDGANGTVVFHPVAGGPAAYGELDPDGRYRIQTGARQGLQLGEYVVTLMVLGPLPPLEPDGRQMPGELLTPNRYGRKDESDLRATVEAGDNQHDFNLTAQ